MRFCDMVNNKEEQIFGINIQPKKNGCEIRWVYPIKYSMVIIFALDSDAEKFDEDKAIRREYKMYRLIKPEESFFVEGRHSFAIFPASYGENDEPILVRQPDPIKTCPINVTYYYTTRKVEIKPKRFFWPAEYSEETYLVLFSSADVSGENIYYQIYSDEKSVAEFCLPFNLKAGDKKEVKVTKKYELFRSTPKVKLIRKEEKKI